MNESIMNINTLSLTIFSDIIIFLHTKYVFNVRKKKWAEINYDYIPIMCIKN